MAVEGLWVGIWGGASLEGRGGEQWAGHPACAGSGATFNADLHETSPHDRRRVAPLHLGWVRREKQTGYEKRQSKLDS